LNEIGSCPLEAETIIVNNNPGDEKIPLIKEQYPRFKFIDNTVNGGFANGCNLGAAHANGEFLLFLNPDTIATEKALADLLDTATQNPDCTILSCRQIDKAGRTCKVSGTFPRLSNLTGWQRAFFKRSKHKISKASGGYSAHAPHIDLTDWVSGSVLLIRADCFIEIGGFDDDFWMYFEDVDFCKRVTARGGQVGVCNTVIIEHNHGGSSRADLRTSSLTKAEVHISRHLYISKHQGRLEAFQMQALLIANNLLIGGLMAALGLVFFFIPKLFSRTRVFVHLLQYYARSAIKRTWISPRSVNSPEARSFESVDKY
jgi:GT2 family glycosyltransferase